MGGHRKKEAHIHYLIYEPRIAQKTGKLRRLWVGENIAKQIAKRRVNISVTSVTTRALTNGVFDIIIQFFQMRTRNCSQKRPRTLLIMRGKSYGEATWAV